MNIACCHCGNRFEKKDWYVKHSTTGTFYCSRKCQIAASRKQVDVSCQRCGKTFGVAEHRATTAKFCSRACRRSGEFHPCAKCGTPVYRAPSHIAGNAVYCSVECANHTQFQSGLAPWNRGVKGIHLSEQSEYKPGRQSEKWVDVGTLSVRKDKQGRQRAWIKVAEPNKWKPRSVLTWIMEHGPIPDGSVVHHKDRDTLNDAIDNLELKTKAEHLNEHRSEFKRHKKSQRQEKPT